MLIVRQRYLAICSGRWSTKRMSGMQKRFASKQMEIRCQCPIALLGAKWGVVWSNNPFSLSHLLKYWYKHPIHRQADTKKAVQLPRSLRQRYSTVRLLAPLSALKPATIGTNFSSNRASRTVLMILVLEATLVFLLTCSTQISWNSVLRGKSSSSRNCSIRAQGRRRKRSSKVSEHL